jgi:hypothetical protein
LEQISWDGSPPREAFKGHRTVGFGNQLDDVSYSNIDNAEKPLVLLLEFLLIENLHGQNTILVHLAAGCE